MVRTYLDGDHAEITKCKATIDNLVSKLSALEAQL